MDDTFEKQLDEMAAQASASEQPKEQQKPVVEPDPLAHLIGSAEDLLEEDPFASMLDGMLAQEGMNKGSETPEFKTEGYEEHQWEFKHELVYGGDEVEAMCKKCCRHMNMRRDQTWNEAMAIYEINPDCGQMLAETVMSS
jgi:hypothetical protein